MVKDGHSVRRLDIECTLVLHALASQWSGMVWRRASLSSEFVRLVQGGCFGERAVLFAEPWSTSFTVVMHLAPFPSAREG